MKFEKFINGKVYYFFEVLYQLIILNLITALIIVLGLGIFTLMPAIVALIVVIRSINNDTNFPVVQVYFQAFKDNFLRMFKLFWFYLLIGVILLFNTYFFYLGYLEYSQVLNLVILFLSLIIDGIFLISFINACFIAVYFPNLNNKKIIKYSFVLLRAITSQAVFMFIMLIVGFYLLFIIPYAYIFILISFFLYIINMLIKSAYQRLVSDGVKPLDAQYYLKNIRKNEVNKI